MLQRAGLTDHLFIAMSNFYYDEKTAYLSALSAVRPPDYNLTPFLEFGLKGIKDSSARGFFRKFAGMFRRSRFLRNTMYDLFGRLQSQRKALIAKRHIQILNLLLEKGEMPLSEVFNLTAGFYKDMKAGSKASLRDLIHLLDVGALQMRNEKPEGGSVKLFMAINLDWPKEITQTGFMEKAKKMPKSKAYSFLTSGG